MVMAKGRQVGIESDHLECEDDITISIDLVPGDLFLCCGSASVWSVRGAESDM
jgi:hypothetical protein